MSDWITISRDEYESLKDRELWADCLDNAGVDNWSAGYDFAREEYLTAKDEGLEETD